jgi:hypothetical protein
MTKFDEKEIRRAFNGLLDYTLRDIIARDQHMTISTASGSNFTLMLVPSADPKYTDLIIDQMNKDAPAL